MKRPIYVVTYQCWVNQIKYYMGVVRFCCIYMRVGEGHTIPEVFTKESVLLFKVILCKIKNARMLSLMPYHNFEVQ